MPGDVHGLASDVEAEFARVDDARQDRSGVDADAQRPDNFNATFHVTDNNPDAVNTQQLSAEAGESITVAEVNLRPVLAAIGNQTVNEGTLFATNAAATDADLPANLLIYSLVAPPVGMTINPVSGAIAWTPTEVQGPFTSTITGRRLPGAVQNQPRRHIVE